MRFALPPWETTPATPVFIPSHMNNFENLDPGQTKFFEAALVISFLQILPHFVWNLDVENHFALKLLVKQRSFDRKRSLPGKIFSLPFSSVPTYQTQIRRLHRKLRNNPDAKRVLSMCASRDSVLWIFRASWMLRSQTFSWPSPPLKMPVPHRKNELIILFDALTVVSQNIF